jgi:hypothetical protein
LNTWIYIHKSLRATMSSLTRRLNLGLFFRKYYVKYEICDGFIQKL